MKGALLVILIAGAIAFFLFKKQAQETLAVTEKGITAIEKARNTAQFADWSHISQALSHYLEDHGQYPEGIQDLFPRYLSQERYLSDPWGTPIRYEKRDDGCTLTAAGPDREFDTADDLVKTI